MTALWRRWQLWRAIRWYHRHPATAYEPGLDNCAGGCRRNDNRRVVFGWYGLTFACPGCFEEVFGAPPCEGQEIITLTSAQVKAGAL